MSALLDPDWDVVPCPQCGAPAEVVDRFDLGSTSGAAGHVKVYCVRRHWLLMLAERLTGGGSASPSPAGSA